MKHFLWVIWIACCLGAFPAAASGQQTSSTAGAANDGSVEGRVLNLAGEPLGKATVTLHDLHIDAYRTYSATTDPDGRFSFRSLKPDHYGLVVDHPGYLRQSYLAEGPRSGGGAVTVEEGQHLTGLIIRLTPEAVVSGRLVDEDKKPVANAKVRLYRYVYERASRYGPADFSGGESDSAGAYQVTGVPPGHFYLMAVPRLTVLPPQGPATGERAEYAYAATYYPGVTEAAAAQSILISVGERRTLGDLVIRKTRVVHVRGRVDLGEPLTSRPAVSATSTDKRSGLEPWEAPQAWVSTEDGSFDLAGVPPGSYILVAQQVLFGRVKTLALQRIVTGEHDLDNLSLALMHDYEVVGKLVYTGTHPSSEFRGEDETATKVRLIATEPATIGFRGGRAKDGAFDFKNVNPARYNVKVLDLREDAYLQSITADGGEDLLANDLDLTRGGGRREITVTLKRPAASIDGSVKDKDGHAVEHIVATLAPKPLDLRQDHRYCRANSDEDGRFSFRGLAPGEYCVYLWRQLPTGDEYSSELLERSAKRCHFVSLQEGRRERLDLTFEPEGESEQQIR